jgi:hypothetical protein
MVQVGMGDKNIVDLMGLKVKGRPVNLICILSLIDAGVDKDFDFVAFKVKTGTGNGTRSPKKFEFHSITP